MNEDLLFDSMAYENELNRLSRLDTRSSQWELRRRASRRVRYAIKNILNGVRPRFKGCSEKGQ